MGRTINRALVRDTFGIIDPATGKQYDDIIFAFIHRDVISDSKLQFNSVLSDLKGETYSIQMDSKTRKKLKEEGLIEVIVSYQKRTTGNYAMVRIYRLDKGEEEE